MLSSSNEQHRTVIEHTQTLRLLKEKTEAFMATIPLHRSHAANMKVVETLGQYVAEAEALQNMVQQAMITTCKVDAMRTYASLEQSTFQFIKETAQVQSFYTVAAEAFLERTVRQQPHVEGSSLH